MSKTKSTEYAMFNAWALQSTKKLLKKTYKICNKYVDFAAHFKKLDGIFKFSIEDLTRLGFNNANMTLTNILKAMKNAPSNGFGKKIYK